MDERVNNISLTFKCDADWRTMTDVADGRYCDKCRQKVYDFTDVKQSEFLKTLAENDNHVCGRFSSQQIAAKPINLPFWKKWTSAAIVLLGFNLFSSKAEAQAAISNHTKIMSKPTETSNFTTGIVAAPVIPMPSFPGGNAAFYKFLGQQLKYKGKTGKVYAQFTIEKNGMLNRIKIVKGLDDITDLEVIRVLKLSPKWHPAKLNGIQVATSYTVPISFSK